MPVRTCVPGRCFSNETGCKQVNSCISRLYSFAPSIVKKGWMPCVKDLLHRFKIQTYCISVRLACALLWYRLHAELQCELGHGKQNPVKSWNQDPPWTVSLWALIYFVCKEIVCIFFIGTVVAAASIANIVKSSLGPVGLDKMLVDDIGVSKHYFQWRF